MKRTLMTLAAAAGLALTASSARADWGGFSPPQGGYPVPTASSEFHDPNTLFGRGAAVPGQAPDRYGLLPGLRKAFHGCEVCGGRGGHFAGCSRGGCGTGLLGGLFSHGGAKHGHGLGAGYGAGAGYGYGNPDPLMMQGTLVFPHHTYVRSPRDFFMYELGR